MKLKAVMSKTTTDMLKSKQRSKDLVELVLDIYCSPEQWAEFVSKYFDVEFEVEVK